MQLKEMMKIMKYEAPIEFGKLAETISEWFAPINYRGLPPQDEANAKTSLRL